MKNITVMLFFCLSFTVLSFDSLSQKSVSSTQEFTDRIISTRKVSDNVRIKYTWNSRIDVLREGKIVDILIQQNKFGPDGSLQKKVLNDQEAPLPKSFLIHQIAEEEKNKTIAFLNGLHEFLEKYSLPDETRVIYFLNKAKILPPDNQGLILLIGENVIRPGDKLSWWLKDNTFSSQKTSVSTLFEEDSIEFTATFATLPDGLNYINFAEIIVPAKNISIQLHNYDYMKSE